MIDIAKVRKAAQLFQEAVRLLDGGPLEYTLTELSAAYDLLVDRFAPFSVGDEVALTKTPVIDECTKPGWLGYKKFLIEGATGIVKTVEAGSAGFVFNVEMDDESILLKDGTTRHADQKHVFRFSEAYLRSADGDRRLYISVNALRELLGQFLAKWAVDQVMAVIDGDETLVRDGVLCRTNIGE